MWTDVKLSQSPQPGQQMHFFWRFNQKHKLEFLTKHKVAHLPNN